MIKYIYSYLILIYLLSYNNVLGKDYYFTDTFGNEIDHIYSNVDNYFSIKKRDNSDLSVLDLNCSKLCYYDEMTSELKVHPAYTDCLYIYILLEDETTDTLSIRVIPPFSRFKIDILQDSSSILQVAYKESIVFDLYFDDSYKYITKFEENVFFIPSIYDSQHDSYLVIRKISYYRYELILPDEVFIQKERIAYFKLLPYLKEFNLLLPIKHKEVIRKIKIFH